MNIWDVILVVNEGMQSSIPKPKNPKPSTPPTRWAQRPVLEVEWNNLIYRGYYNPKYPLFIRPVIGVGIAPLTNTFRIEIYTVDHLMASQPTLGTTPEKYGFVKGLLAMGFP